MCCVVADQLLDVNSSPQNEDSGSFSVDGSPEQSINVDDLMVDSSIMFPILDSVDDVNEMFGELELLLSVSVCFYFGHYTATVKCLNNAGHL